MKPPLFQDSPWYVRVWRFRWYLLIPFEALDFYLAEQEDDKGNKQFFSWRFCYGMAVGLAQCRMNWVYDMEDLFND